MSQKKKPLKPTVWNINTIKQKLGPEICKNLLFLHAILGCDTASQLYMILEKVFCLRNLGQANIFKSKQKSFMHHQLYQDIIAAGEQALMTLYNGRPGETLDYFCYRCFCEKVATNTTFLHPQTLPLTSA